MKSFIKTDNTAWRIIEGQAFVINTRSSMLHELDETGTFIWKLIEKGKRHDEIAYELAAHFDVDKEQALKDIKEFVAELEHKGILE